MRWRLVQACGPFFSWIPPWWALRLYYRLAGNPGEQGGFDGALLERGVRPHNFLMTLHLDDWMERFTAITGFFYGIDVTATVERFMGSGDTFVDVGANVGFLSFTAARCVGPSGMVIAVEPHKHLADRLRECAVRNRVQNLYVLNTALGDQKGRARLYSPGHHGAGSLIHQDREGPSVSVERADDVLRNVARDGRCLVKIDVEGYELLVLRGMTSLLQRPQTGFLIEVTDRWLRKAGGSAAALFALMREAGYSAYRPVLSKTSVLSFEPLEWHLESKPQYDALFVRAADGWI